MIIPRIGMLAVLIAAWSAGAHARTCESLAALATAKVEIVDALTMAPGTFKPPGDSPPVGQLPAFCRVVLRLKPTADSDIGAEVWLPANWNTKLVMLGNGGWGGSIDYYDEMADTLRRGYAVGATDDGHQSRGAGFIPGHPEKFIDFAYRAEHETTAEAKTLVKALYARPSSRAYWQGCSGGGREGLIQAHRYPDEFDGIIAGDPADVRRNAWALWLATQALRDPAAYIPPGKYAMIHNAVLAACDANDGLKDGLIEDPENCHVDFSALRCTARNDSDCLTAPQVKTAQAMISPATTPSGKVLFPGLEPGTELLWGRLAGGPKPADLFVDQFRYIVREPNAADSAESISRESSENSPQLQV
jgi:feruloyl esterase